MKACTSRWWDDIFFIRGLKHEVNESEESEISDEYFKGSASVSLVGENDVKEFGISDKVLEFVLAWCVLHMQSKFVRTEYVTEKKGTEFGISERFFILFVYVCVIVSL